jgi:hypothetical protein
MIEKFINTGVLIQLIFNKTKFLIIEYITYKNFFKNTYSAFLYSVLLLSLRFLI